MLRVADAGRPFNDAHFLMALLAADRAAEAKDLIANVRKVAATPGAVSQRLNQEVGVPLLEGVQAWMLGEFASAVARLMPIRYQIHRVGGSHAQRDLFQLTLIDAALKSSQFGLARALLGERTALKPGSAWTWSLAAQALAGIGDVTGARRARARADQLLAA
ncbi:MAG: hypothetical protein EXQ96_06690 [Alphaproteobacteria bacterium]|nr:hypothetical protein [Alphaproteobacteria bacterium]